MFQERYLNTGYSAVEIFKKKMEVGGHFDYTGGKSEKAPEKNVTPEMNFGNRLYRPTGQVGWGMPSAERSSEMIQIHTIREQAVQKGWFAGQHEQGE